MDILKALKQDHEEALTLARRMADSDDVRQARERFMQLKVALTAHARAEESVVYAALKRLGDDPARELAFEGEVEHALCDQLLAEMAAGRAGRDSWQAKAKVVAELLEHHIDEEHRDMFPKVRKHFDADLRARMGERFMRLKDQHLAAA